MRRALTIGFCMALGLVACTSSSPPALLATYSPTGGTNDVSLAGTLSVHRGCIMLKTAESTFEMLLWPDGFAVGSNDSGDVTVLDGSGRVSAAVGDSVNLDGGPTISAVAASVPAGCKTEHMFRVSQVDVVS